MRLVEKIVSGGQTGADRAALDFAIEHGISHGGWCPKGRMAEDGSIHARYCLQETPIRSYPQRTEWNVRDSDSKSWLGKAIDTGGDAIKLRALDDPDLEPLWESLRQP